MGVSTTAQVNHCIKVTLDATLHVRELTTLNVVVINMKWLVGILISVVLILVSVTSESGIIFIGGVYDTPEPSKASSKDVQPVKKDAAIVTYTYD